MAQDCCKRACPLSDCISRIHRQRLRQVHFQSLPIQPQRDYISNGDAVIHCQEGLQLHASEQGTVT